MPCVLATWWFRAVLVVLGCAGTLLVGAEPALAHDGTSGAIALTVTDQRVLGTAQVTFTELGYRDTTGDGLIDADELRAQEATVATSLVSVVREHVALEVDGRKVDIIGAGPAPVSQGQDLASTFVEIVFATGPHDGAVSQVDLSWSFTSPTDQVVLSGPDGLVTGRLADDGTTSISLDAVSTVRSFFLTGIDHVRSGLDHLLFLVVLTFAVVGSTVSRTTTRRVVKLVTAFTIGHATSLCLAYFDIVSIPAQWVEPAISLSIVAAAVLAIRRKGDTIRPWIAAAVGWYTDWGSPPAWAGSAWPPTTRSVRGGVQRRHRRRPDHRGAAGDGGDLGSQQASRRAPRLGSDRGLWQRRTHRPDLDRLPAGPLSRWQPQDRGPQQPG